MTNVAALLVAVFPLATPPPDDVSRIVQAGPVALAQQEPPPPPQYTPPPPPPEYPPPPPPPYRRHEKQRRPWYVGFGFGSGDGRIKDGFGSSSFGDYFGSGASTSTYAFEFQVGATLSPRLLLGADWMGIGTFADLNGDSGSLFIQTFDGVVTYFPNERGFFLRGGAGFSAYSYEIPTAFGTLSNDFGGVNVLAGLGYAFWLGRSFNLTLNLDYSAQRYAGDSSDPLAPTSSWFWVAYLGFAWY